MDHLEVIEDALDVLAEHLVLNEESGPTTHTAITAARFEHPEVPPALGRYFVGVLGGAVNQRAELSREILNIDPDFSSEVRGHIDTHIGVSNDFPDQPAREFRDHTRNPYIVEVLAHALLVLRKRGDTACLVGPTAALKPPHPDPRRQGIDLLGIYDDSGIAIAAVGEAKASKNNGTAQLSRAAAFFADLDAGKRGVEMRTELGSLKDVLPEPLRAGFVPMMWRRRCCYLPVVVHSGSLPVLVDRKSLGDLSPDQEHIRVIGLDLDDFYGFFDQVADGIRAAQGELLS
ncbi:MAG: hypothetical protein ACTHNP_09225 [Solirubrobacterales bacterium]